MHLKKSACFLVIVLPLVVGLFLSAPISIGNQPEQQSESIVDLENGDTVHVGPDEVLQKYEISSVPAEIAGSGAPLNGSEYGNRTDIFDDETMYYDAGTGETSTANLSVPMGEEWEGYKVRTQLSELTENRTWLLNHDFENSGTWSY
ncbi:MAG: hypothetical protein ACOC3C_03790, partial [Candidatus Thorarchaeota archaeon]